MTGIIAKTISNDTKEFTILEYKKNCKTCSCNKQCTFAQTELTSNMNVMLLNHDPLEHEDYLIDILKSLALGRTNLVVDIHSCSDSIDTKFWRKLKESKLIDPSSNSDLNLGLSIRYHECIA